jgi:hypothetical protein
MRIPKLPIRPAIALAASVIAAITLAGCSEPVAPGASRPDAVGSPSIVKQLAAEHLTIPVTFTIPGGTCGPESTVTGTGVFNIVTRSIQDGTGAWHVSFSWNAHGTATGEDGSTYIFNYAINAKSVDPSGADDLVVIVLVDHFNLQGQGQTPDLRVYLRGTFEFATFTPIGDAVIRGPGIFCDPI